VADRGRTPEYVRAQYERTVRPGAEQFVVPTREYADLVVSGEQPFEQSTGAVLRLLRGVASGAGRGTRAL
jgi:uridine kinase